MWAGMSAFHRPTVRGLSFTGHITAVDSLVDEATRNVQAQATLANPGGLLRPGMFVQAEVTLGGRAPSSRCPRPQSAMRRTATRSSS